MGVRRRKTEVSAIVKTIGTFYFLCSVSASLSVGMSGCSDDAKPIGSDSAVADTTVKLHSNSMIVEPNQKHQLQLPDGFSLDTVAYFDSVQANEVFMVLPASGDSKANEIVRKQIKSRLSEFQSGIDTAEPLLSFTGSSFYAVPNSITVRGNVISYCYVIDVYRNGAAHGMMVFESFNYDNVKKKLISFNDFFTVESHDDSVLLLTEIESKLQLMDPSLDAVYEMDFCLLGDSVAFNFDDYEIASYAEGSSQAVVARNKIGKLIRTQYQ